MSANELGIDPPRSGPPPLIPIGPAPPWVTILAAAFGALTLAGLFWFAYISGQNPAFICNAFTLLAAVFALGAGLAAGFIGGAAAVTGNLGSSAKDNPIWFSAGGGVAVFVISFVMFHVFNIKEDVCQSKQKIDSQTAQIHKLTEDEANLQTKMVELHKQVKGYEELKRKAAGLEAELSKFQTNLKKLVIVTYAPPKPPIMIEYMSVSVWTKASTSSWKLIRN